MHNKKLASDINSIIWYIFHSNTIQYVIKMNFFDSNEFVTIKFLQVMLQHKLQKLFKERI